jgi:hypothetical protein
VCVFLSVLLLISVLVWVSPDGDFHCVYSGWDGGGGGCTDTRFITSFLHSDFMNRSVITTARDVEETERERGRRGEAYGKERIVACCTEREQ